jgi:uncharacterized protein YbjT (DUF2867 family)
MQHPTPDHVLVIGATGSIGRHVVDRAGRAGLEVRALARDPRRAASLLGSSSEHVEVVAGDLTDRASLKAAVADLSDNDAIVFTHGGDAAPERVSYGGVASVLDALGERRPRIALMSSINVTRDDNGSYQSLLDWKRRGERLVRVFGAPYTIVRPGWFGGGGIQRPVLRQGDTSASGAVSRETVAEVLVRTLTSAAAVGRTFELFSEPGAAPSDWDTVFTTVDPDSGLDGAHDAATLPVTGEPSNVRADLDRYLHQ